MARTASFLKICVLLFGVLMLSGMAGCPRDSDGERGGGESGVGGGSATDGGSGY